MTTKRTPLICIEKGNYYRRYSGKTVTNHIISDRPLTRREVEMYRTYPEVFISSTTDPEVA